MLVLKFHKFLLTSMRALLLNLIKAELYQYTFVKPSLSLLSVTYFLAKLRSCCMLYLYTEAQYNRGMLWSSNNGE